MYQLSQRVRFALMAGFVMLLGMGVLYSVNSSSLHTAVTLVDSDTELISVRVNPFDASLESGEALEFTAYGKYSTMTVPVDVEWELEDDDLGTLSCEGDESKTCTFTAGDEPGETVLTIEKDGLMDTADIEVVGEIENPFEDDIPDWADNDIVELYDLGIINGYDDGNYGAADSLTRSQIVTLLYRVMDLYDLLDEMDDESCDVYSDVDSEHFAYEPVCYFYYSDWLEEAMGDAYRPNDPAPRGLTSFYVYNSFGDMLAEAMDMDEDEFPDVDFSDVTEDHAYYDAIVAMNAYGVMTGYDSGEFGPDNELNRAEAAVVIGRVITFTGLE